jgi:hypothetical protein
MVMTATVPVNDNIIRVQGKYLQTVGGSLDLAKKITSSADLLALTVRDLEIFFDHTPNGYDLLETSNEARRENKLTFAGYMTAIITANNGSTLIN